jgi:hypothetical protein
VNLKQNNLSLERAIMGKPNRKANETSFDSEEDNYTKLILGAIENSLKVLTDKLDKQEETIKTLAQKNSALLGEVTRLRANQQYFN